MTQSLHGFSVVGYIYDQKDKMTVDLDMYFHSEDEKKQWTKKIESDALSELYKTKIDII